MGGAALWVDAGFPYLMVYTGDTLGEVQRRRRAVAIEPMTCPPNALRTGTDVHRARARAGVDGPLGDRAPVSATSVSDGVRWRAGRRGHRLVERHRCRHGAGLRRRGRRRARQLVALGRGG